MPRAIRSAFVSGFLILLPFLLAYLLIGGVYSALWMCRRYTGSRAGYLPRLVLNCAAWPAGMFIDWLEGSE